jgi:anti-anti-sigma factor
VSEFRYQTACLGNGCRIVLLGTMNAGKELTAFEEEINRLMAQGKTSLSLNLKSIDYISSSGIGLLIRLHVRAQKRSINLTLTELSEPSRKVFQTMHLFDVFQIIE